MFDDFLCLLFWAFRNLIKSLKDLYLERKSRPFAYDRLNLYVSLESLTNLLAYRQPDTMGILALLRCSLIPEEAERYEDLLDFFLCKSNAFISDRNSEIEVFSIQYDKSFYFDCPLSRVLY